MEKAQLADEVKNRTCKPKWKGLKFIHRVARHYSDQLITDKQAVDLLKKGLLTEADFLTLPAGYVAGPAPTEPEPEPEGDVTPIPDAVPTHVKKHRNRRKK